MIMRMNHVSNKFLASADEAAFSAFHVPHLFVPAQTVTFFEFLTLLARSLLNVRRITTAFALSLNNFF